MVAPAGRRCLQCDALLLLGAPGDDLFCNESCKAIHRYVQRARPVGAFTTTSVRIPLETARVIDRLAARARVSRQVFLELLVSADVSSARAAEISALCRGGAG